MLALPIPKHMSENLGCSDFQHRDGTRSSPKHRLSIRTSPTSHVLAHSISRAIANSNQL